MSTITIVIITRKMQLEIASVVAIIWILTNVLQVKSMGKLNSLINEWPYREISV